jgi:hypothetical protein
MLTIIGPSCALGADDRPNPLEMIRAILRDESRELAEVFKKPSKTPLTRFPVGQLARAQAIAGDLDGALKTASIPKGPGVKAQRARDEAIGDVGDYFARQDMLSKALTIVQGSSVKVKVRVALAFAESHAKLKPGIARGVLNAVRSIARGLKLRDKIRTLNKIAIIQSNTGDMPGSAKICTQAAKNVRLLTSPRERVWALTGVVKAASEAGHGALVSKLADEVLSDIEKVNGLQADEIKTDAKKDLELIRLPVLPPPETPDKSTAENVNKLLSQKKYPQAIKEADEFANDLARAESLLRIALAMVRDGKRQQAQEIVNGVEGYVAASESRALRWLVMEKPESWTYYRIEEGAEGPMRMRITALAIPLWYELQANGDRTKSPVELLDRGIWWMDDGLLETVVRADAKCGDLKVVMRWVKEYLKGRSPGNSTRISMYAVIADQAVKRRNEPHPVLHKPTKKPNDPIIMTTDDTDPPPPAPPPSDPIVPTKVDTGPAAVLLNKLARQFDKITAKQAGYPNRVSRECKRFPEGDLFPYVLPAIAYANMTLDDPLMRSEALKRMAGLLDAAVVSTIKAVKPPGGDLAKLTSYKKHGTYLGQLNMALGYYRLIGGDKRYDAINKAISDVLHKALVESKGRPLKSFPTYSWTFDTVAVALSLRLYDYNTDSTRSAAAIKSYLEWMGKNGIHGATKLPYSVINSAGKGMKLPRGCDLSWRISMLAQLDAPLAKSMYDAYVKSFWLDRQGISGFAEWPGGKGGGQDADSGPIVMGIGMTASGMGIAAASSTGDTKRRDQLLAQTMSFKTLVRQLALMSPQMKKMLTMGGQIDSASDYVTGFLYGDATLFYAVSWRQLPCK